MGGASDRAFLRGGRRRARLSLADLRPAIPRLRSGAAFARFGLCLLPPSFWLRRSRFTRGAPWSRSGREGFAREPARDPAARRGQELPRREPQAGAALARSKFFEALRGFRAPGEIRASRRSSRRACASSFHTHLAREALLAGLLADLPRPSGGARCRRGGSAASGSSPDQALA
jgi:hypothetical protein